jgi:hypothetical protein
MKGFKVIARIALAAALAATIPVGCGSSTAGPKEGEDATIGQIWRIFHSYKKTNKPPPKGPGDLLSMQRAFPAAIDAIQSKQALVYWGVGLEDGAEAASTVLAYQKDVPEKGGAVLMQDGSTRTITAEEFHSARKPPGATTETKASGPNRK